MWVIGQPSTWMPRSREINAPFLAFFQENDSASDNHLPKDQPKCQTWKNKTMVSIIANYS